VGSPLVRWLAGRSPDELTTILTRRPDTLAGPPLTDLGTLAGRLQMNGSVLTAFATVPLPALQVVDAMAHCGGPAVTIHRLATVLGRPVDDPDLTAALTGLAERALVWADADGRLRMAGALWSACAGPRHDGTRASFDPEPPALTHTAAPADAVSREATAAGTLAVERVGALLEAAPIALLKSGGVGSRELRRLGPDARLWLELTFGAGLLGYADGGLTPTPAYDDWCAASPGGRLVPLLRAWRTLPVAATATYRPDGEPAGAALTADPSWSAVVEVRAALAALLGDLPAGAGATDDSVAELMRWRLPVLVPETSLVDALLAEARLVGAVAHGALTPLGRAVFETDPGVLTATAEQQLPSAVTKAVFQNDLTALVPGVPTGALADLLDAAADRESRTGAATWRFGAASVRAALDAGYTASSLREALLAAAAGGTLPQALEYLIADVGRQHGRIRVRPVACVVHAAEPALIKELLRNRALRTLRLQALAPTVLASGQPLAATLDALRAAGYAPVGEDVTGAPTLTRRPATRGVPRRRAGHVPAARTTPDVADVSALAKRLLAHGSARAARLEVAPDGPEAEGRAGRRGAGPQARGDAGRRGDPAFGRPGETASGARGDADGGTLEPRGGDLPRRLEVATTQRAGTTLEPSEPTHPPLLWLVPDPPPEPSADPDQVASIVRRHARTLAETDRDLLVRAIASGDPVRIDYRDSGGEFSTRVIEPLELDQVLLTAWCQLRDAERVFAIDRIESVSPA
jgi:hypothetical protein